jgi:arylformamidase
MPAIYDITRPITPALAVWPGDTPYTACWIMRLDRGDPANLSTLSLSAHTGTHADAPYHFIENGPPMGDMPLDAYLGPATVLSLEVSGAILPQHLEGLDLERVERLLIKTPASRRPHARWDTDFAYLSPRAALLLAEHRLRLFGSDAPSVDPYHSETLDAHKILHAGGVAILETLFLAEVPPGDYELIALPLKLDGDGSPVRAVLRPLA